MKFLAIDTSARRLCVVAYHNGKTSLCEVADCAHAHSVRLMDEIANALNEVELTPSDCDFFAVVIGPGSFTGIRIGISTVKGLCFATGKPALAITSFQALAYAEKGEKQLALVDAGHGAYYAEAYDGETVAVKGAYMSGEQVQALIAEGYLPIASEGVPFAKEVNASIGLQNAVFARREDFISAQTLTALYLRKSSAEENKK